MVMVNTAWTYGSSRAQQGVRGVRGAMHGHGKHHLHVRQQQGAAGCEEPCEASGSQ